MIRYFILLVIIFPCLVSAQIPNYYSNIDFTKTGDSLKTQLTQLISSTHTTPLWYTSTSSPDTWNALKQSDLVIGDTNNVLLVYGYNDTDAITKNDRTRSKDSSCHTSGCNGLWNREHVFPQSKANPNLNTQFPSAGTDAHNLRASDGQMNTSRSNRSYESGSGNSNINSNGNFYPGDEWRGDIARILMYMYVRYQNQCEPINVAVGSTSFSPNGDMPNILLEWNALDSVSEYEKVRNNTFHTMQGNRNPFIDNPYLATRIWNGTIAQNTWNVPLSINQEQLNEVKVYPTQTSGPVYIENNTFELEYKIYDLLGRQVQVDKQHNIIDISSLAEGQYFLKLVANDGRNRTFKIALDK